MQANFTPRSQEILHLAKKIAKNFLHKSVQLEHLFLAFVKIDSFVLPLIESHVNNSFVEVELLLVETLKSMPSSDVIEEVVFSEEVQMCINQALEISKKNHHSYVSVEHLFYSMIVHPKSNVIDYLVACDIDPIKTEDLLLQILSEDVMTDINTQKDLISEFIANSQNDMLNPSQISKPLDLYGKNLNQLAKNNKFDFIFPNPYYISQLESVLCRKVKCNALLVGDAGVGKTALVEGLAKNIVNLESNDYLISKKIISLDLSVMIAGTKYRGQFEERLNNCIDQAKQDKHTILFIDEIHTIVGAGNSEGSLDAANILKPYIARGEITCIGSTTHEEYRATFGKDAALKRRFEVIKIDEPDEDEVKSLLGNILPSYCDFHNVSYHKDTIDEVIKLSNHYINNRKFPDKALDLIDQAGANVKIAYYKKPESAKRMEKVLMSDDVDVDVKTKVYSSYKQIMERWGKRKSKNPSIVMPKDIKKIISDKFSIPLSALEETASSKLLKLESRINKDIIGQHEAVSKICNSLFKSHCGLNDENRPIGSFLFLGKTGVGKTLTSKSLAKHYFGSSKKLIYFDMSEFSESTSVSKFSGSSPGYVGYEKGGILTEKIKREPHSVLLFDEIEKAHPVVLQSLLQILEEGRMTDNTGEETCFKNTIIILTSNLGAEFIDKDTAVGFLNNHISHEDKIFTEAQKKLSPELVNRFDGIVLFNNFNDKDLLKIVNIELNKVKNKLKNKNILIKFSKSIKDYILNKAKKENLGGRPVRRIIQNELEVCIAKHILNNTSSRLKVFLKNDTIYCDDF